MRILSALLLFFVSLGAASAQEVLLYIGTYTNSGSKGVYVSRFNLQTGGLSAPELAAEVDNPTFLAIHPTKKYLYTAGEIGNFRGERAGAVSAFSINPKSGKLTLLNQVSSKGGGPCHVSIDKTGSTCMVANYGGGSVAAMAIGPDGRLAESKSFHQHDGKSANEKRQEKAHAHSINPSPGNRYAVAADLGTDMLYVYKLDAANATLTLNQPPGAKSAPGAGPRHFSFHPNGKWAYAINELGNTIAAYSWDEKTGTLKEIGTVGTLPAGFSKTSYTAEVRVHPSGKFLYGSNRGMDTIAVFKLDAKGLPELIQTISTGGETPRNFTLDQHGKWLLAANQKTGNIAVFSVDAATGKLTDTGKRAEVSAPVCLRTLE